MGVVYQATQLSLGRLVAVKAMAPTLVADPSYRERFKRESQLAAMIDHPNIIPVYEAGEVDGTLYLIMRWVDGTDLRDVVSAGPLTPARAVRLLRPVASALGAAHKQGLVHRDVKPANVLIAAGDEQREEHVYLTDFGIARRDAAHSAITRTGMFVGTLDYMAPERLIGDKGESSSDIYAFGCMLFEALTGRLPYDRPNDAAKAFAHVNDPIPSVRAAAPEVPQALDAVVARALAKRPGERFGSAGELTRALDQALAESAPGEPVIVEETVLSADQTVLSADQTVLSADQTVLSADETVLSPDETALSAGSTAPPAPAPSPTATAATARQVSPPALVASPTPGRRPPRRRLVVWAPVVVLVGAAVIVFVVSSGSPRHTPGSEVKTLSPGLTELHTVSLGSVAGGVTVGQQGELWVSLPDRGSVARISADGAVTKLSLGDHPGQIASGPAGIWVGGSSRGALVRLDEQTGRVLATSSLHATPSALTVNRDDGSAWAADSTGSVVHIALDGGVSGNPAHLTPPVLGLGWGEGWVWAVNGTTTGLVRVSQDGSGGTSTFDTRPEPVSITFSRGIWTAHANGSVTRFDPRPSHLRVNTEVPVAPSLRQISAVEAQPSVWAISQRSHMLYRISTQPNAPITGTAALASSPVGLAVGETSVWVATADGNITQIGFGS